MPKIKSYTPPWLTEPAPGHSLFVPSEADLKASTASPYASRKRSGSGPGPRRTIARRGTEVFVANGRELKWGDLVYLKDAWDAEHNQRGRGTPIKRESSNDLFHSYDDRTNGDIRFKHGYRTIKTPVADDIRQLVMSPQADYLAILTSHTIHICLLPDSSHLTAEDSQTPLKPRYFTLGPTTHVTSRSPVASAIWHPLGVNGSALVTVTQDAVVRVWELSPLDRWSFDSPTLAIDLKKLADGTTLDQDFSAAASTTNKTYSPDSFDMEVAGACFGDRSAGGWSSMTLWVAMRGGDVYALCPLLPHRWAPPPTLVPSLSVSIVAKVAVLEDDPKTPVQTALLARQQMQWMTDLDKQEPKIVETGVGEAAAEIYTRPAHPGVVPRLQGPFDIELDPESEFDQDSELCDIYVIGEKTDTHDLMKDEDVELEGADQEGLSLSVICLLSTSGKLRVCLDLDGVEAQWLPPRNRSKGSRQLEDPEPPSLLTFQSLDVLRERERRAGSWSTFSPDVTSRYSFFITHPFGITYISLSPWVFRLEQELQADSEAGSDFRIGLLVNGHSSIRERVYTHPQEGTLATCTAIRDPDLGYFLLSATHHSAIALLFESPEDQVRASVLRETTPVVKQEEEEEVARLDLAPTRPAFQIPEELSERSELERAKGMLFTSRYQTLKDQEVRLSPATLEIFTNTHRLVGAESGRLNRAAAQLFTKLESLPAELHEQVAKANMLKQRIERVTGEDVEQRNPVTDNVRLRERLERAKKRQEQLAGRMEELKRTINMATGRELSDKEKAWIQEVRALEASIEASEESTASAFPVKPKQLPRERLEAVKALKDELVGQAAALQKQGTSSGGNKEGAEALSLSVPNLKVPADIRKAKTAHILSLLERETALVDGAKSRLERLSLG